MATDTASRHGLCDNACGPVHIVYLFERLDAGLSPVQQAGLSGCVHQAGLSETHSMHQLLQGNTLEVAGGQGGVLATPLG